MRAGTVAQKKTDKKKCTTVPNAKYYKSKIKYWYGLSYQLLFSLTIVFRREPDSNLKKHSLRRMSISLKDKNWTAIEKTNLW